MQNLSASTAYKEVAEEYPAVGRIFLFCMLLRSTAIADKYIYMILLPEIMIVDKIIETNKRLIFICFLYIIK